MPTEISVKFSTVDFLGTDPDNALSYDLDKSIEQYAEQLQAAIQDEYPEATVEVEWTSENMTRTIMYVVPDDTYEQYVTSDDVKENIQRISEDLYGDFDRWLVDGFNTEAWTEKIDAQIDRADTGDVLTITIGKAGPMETQDAIVEIVVLDAGYGKRGKVAYRYSTASQDEEWQIDSAEDAVAYAADCYKNLNWKENNE